MLIVGCDVGKAGGVASIDADTGKLIEGIRMPILKHGKRDVVNPRPLNELAYPVYDVDAVVIEQVSAMPGNGITSMFNFGRHTGAVESWAMGLGCPVHWVTPQKWKKYFGLSRDKRASLDRARLEFGEDPRWDVLANDGIAESSLIALWFYRTQR